MFKLFGYFPEAMDKLSATKEFDVAKLMLIALNEYNFLTSPGGQALDEIINFEK